MKEKNFKELLKEAKKFLNLKYHPVGVYFSQEKYEGEEKFFACVGLKRALCGEEIIMTKDTISCFGGLHWLGFEDMSSGLTHILTEIEKLFKDQKVFKRWLEIVPAPPLGKFSSIKLSPSLKDSDIPSLLIFAGNPHQIHRIHSALIYSTGDLIIPHYYSALCQGAITNPFITDIPSITIPDTFAREICGFEMETIIFSIPYRWVEAFFDGLFNSDGAKEKILPSLKKFLKK
jgi:uncharacterized protein (DUF169 family)